MDVDLQLMSNVEKTYENLKFQIPYLDFKGLLTCNDEGMNWQSFADDFIFEPRTPFIRSSIKTVYASKVKSEKEFKRKLDSFVIRSNDMTLVSLGLAKAFIEKLKRYVTLVNTDKKV